MNKDGRVLRLVNNISNGKKTYAQVKREIDGIENKFGELDLLYQVEDRTDLDYAQKLINDVRIGVYSKESILKLGMIYNNQGQRYKKEKICICIIALVILLLIGLLMLLI